jgi:hypothetical protein
LHKRTKDRKAFLAGILALLEQVGPEMPSADVFLSLTKKILAKFQTLQFLSSMSEGSTLAKNVQQVVQGFHNHSAHKGALVAMISTNLSPDFVSSLGITPAYAHEMRYMLKNADSEPSLWAEKQKIHPRVKILSEERDGIGAWLQSVTRGGAVGLHPRPTYVI